MNVRERAIPSSILTFTLKTSSVTNVARGISSAPW